MSVFAQVMDDLGFYHQGEPTAGVYASREGDLVGPAGRPASVERRLRYRAVLDNAKLGATAVYELNGSPCIYFKRIGDEPSPAELARWHRAAWNSGLAPLLWVVSPAHVRIYSCFVDRPRSTESWTLEASELALFQTTATGLAELGEKASRAQLESGRFWSDGPGSVVDRRKRVDTALLQDLVSAASLLRKEGWDGGAVDRTLLAVLLVLTLEHRGMFPHTRMRSELGFSSLADASESGTTILRLFAWLTNSFFPDLVRADWDETNHSQVQALAIQDLLASRDPLSGQGRLWPYDFSVIPIELLSSLYQALSEGDGELSARALGTHATPLSLVDLVLEEGFETLGAQARVLDPACGSGAFLVEALRRLVALHLSTQTDEEPGVAARRVIGTQLVGVDVSHTAISIALLGLYLALLEYDSQGDGRELQPLPLLRGVALFLVDYFDTDSAEFRSDAFAESFDAIVGNPPWTRRTGTTTYTKYCQERGYQLPRLQPPDIAFAWRSLDFAHPGTKVVLVVHAQRLHSHFPASAHARKQLLSRVAMQRIVSLAELRSERLFSNGSAPATVVSFLARAPTENDIVSVVAASGDPDFRRHGSLAFTPDSPARVGAIELEDEDLLKVAMWGGGRDWRLIQRLRSFPTVGQFWQERKWPKGEGYQRQGAGATALPTMEGKPMLGSGYNAPYFIVTEDLPRVPDGAKWKRPRKPEIYRAPLVVCSQGVSRSAGVYAMRSVSDVFYSEQYFGFTAPRDFEPIVQYLNAVLNSTIAKYFLFLTASSWGLERAKLEAYDIMRVPFPNPADLPEGLLLTIGRLEEEVCAEAREGSAVSRRLQVEIDQALLEAYQITPDEWLVIRDFVADVVEPYIRGKRSPGISVVEVESVKDYAGVLRRTLEPLLGAIWGEYIGATVVWVPGASAQVVRLELGLSAPSESVEVVERAWYRSVLDELSMRLDRSAEGAILARRYARIYDGERLYVLKPAQAELWSGRAALLDADRILEDQFDARVG